MSLSSLVDKFRRLSQRLRETIHRHKSGYTFLKDVLAAVDRFIPSLVELQTRISNINGHSPYNGGKGQIPAYQSTLDDICNSCESTFTILSSQIDNLRLRSSLKWFPLASTFKYLFTKYTFDWRLRPLEEHRLAIQSLLQSLPESTQLETVEHEAAGQDDHDDGFIHIQKDEGEDSNHSPKFGGTITETEPSATTLRRLLSIVEPTDLSGKVELKYGPPIAFGNFSSLHMAYLDKTQVVVKIAKARKQQKPDVTWEAELDEGLREIIKLWTVLNHRNILEFLGYTNDIGDFPVMVSPWYQHRDASRYLSSTPSLSPSTRLRLVQDVASGLDYLHSYEVIHGDIKPKNIIIDDDIVAKLCDFGLYALSNKHSPTGMTETSPYGERERYKAPELFPSKHNRHPQPTLASDIYSLGCIAYNFTQRKQPYYEFETLYEVLDAIRDRDPPALKPDDMQSNPDVQLWTFLEACWNSNTTLRPNARNAVSMLSEIHMV